MTLRDVIETEGEATIEYYTQYNEVDIFAGVCKYLNGKLIPLDGDSYSLDDKIDNYNTFIDAATGKKIIAVFYESEWITG